MGVSGSGKSTVGAALAALLGLPFMDGDDLHPQANIQKMSQGIPLNDEDRWPWLERVGAWLHSHPGGGVVACSALKRSYRDAILADCPTALFAHCTGSRELLEQRMRNRGEHFMPVKLLDSQFDTLEVPTPDEPARSFDITESPVVLAGRIRDWIADADQ